jgi:hypothetical protein
MSFANLTEAEDFIRNETEAVREETLEMSELDT